MFQNTRLRLLNACLYALAYQVETESSQGLGRHSTWNNKRLSNGNFSFFSASRDFAEKREDDVQPTAE